MEDQLLNNDYIGNLENENVENIDNSFLSDYRRQATFRLAALKLKCYPCEISFENSYGEMYCFDSFMEFIKFRFNHDKNINDLTFKRRAYEFYLMELIPNELIVFSNNIHFEKDVVYKDELSSSQKSKDNHRVFEDLIVYFRPDYTSVAEEIILKCQTFKMEKIEQNVINMICLGYDEEDEEYLYLTEIKIKEPKISDLQLHYGDAFSHVHENILNELNKEQTHGLILLHGLYGTGKTNYLRYLIKKMKNKKQIIYIPPEMIGYISDPQYLPFMLRNTDSILIIEDAENIIKCRSSDESTTQAVANLLNLTDGLLGDSLRQPIIATFNCDLSTIDPALLRKGRLIAQHEFGKLNIENAQKLSDQLGFNTKINEPMTLADIYCQD